MPEKCEGYLCEGRVDGHMELRDGDECDVVFWRQAELCLGSLKCCGGIQHISFCGTRMAVWCETRRDVPRALVNWEEE